LSEGRDSTVIGAGIVGLCTALALQERNHRVLLVDRAGPGEGTSSGNAGIISVDSVHPEAMPGIWRDLPAMVLRPLAPVTLRPAYLPSFLPWLLRFLRNATAARAEAASTALHALSNPGLTFLHSLASKADAGDLLRQEGLLYVYETPEQMAKARAHCAFYDRRGVPYRILDDAQLREQEPALRPGLGGAVFIPAAGHTLSPLDLSRALFRRFQSQGGRFLQRDVRSLGTAGRRVTGIEGEEPLPCDEVFVTAGAWSHQLASHLGSTVPLDTERGYHQELPDPGIHLRCPILFPASGFAATTMRGGLRLAGTVEFAGRDAPPDYRRAEILSAQAQRLFPDLNAAGARSWMGYRPSLPDSLPVVSASPHFDNVWFGFGHGHLGLTQSAVTGACLAAMATGGTPPVDPAPYRIDRRY